MLETLFSHYNYMAFFLRSRACNSETCGPILLEFKLGRDFMILDFRRAPLRSSMIASFFHALTDLAFGIFVIGISMANFLTVKSFVTTLIP